MYNMSFGFFRIGFLRNQTFTSNISDDRHLKLMVIDLNGTNFSSSASTQSPPWKTRTRR